MSSSRERLLDAAQSLVSAGGAGVPMAEVASAAGVSRQALYQHFPSRAALLVAVVRRMDDRDGIRRRCARALAAPDALDACRRFLDAWLRYAFTILPVADALLASRRDDDDAAQAWADRMAELREGFVAAVGRLADAGLLRAGLDERRAADLAWAMASAPVVGQLIADRNWSPAAVRRELADGVVAALTGV